MEEGLAAMTGITELELLALKYSLSPTVLKVLRAVAVHPAIDLAHWCRIYLPDLSPEDARRFMQWLATQPE